MKKQGYIFINSFGQYARIYTQNTHGGSRECVEWVTDLNAAQVFPNEHMTKRRIKELRDTVAVKAQSIVVVTIKDW